VIWQSGSANLTENNELHKEQTAIITMFTNNTAQKNEFISTHTVAVNSDEGKSKPTTTAVRLHSVPIFTAIPASLTGDVEVYVRSRDEAAAKVQLKSDRNFLTRLDRLGIDVAMVTVVR
jgi:hypothetical protein